MNIQQKTLRLNSGRSSVSAATPTWRFIQADQNRCDDALRATRVPRWKRVLDITGLLLALPAALLFTLLFAVAVKVLSPGPVFFKQERIGHRRQRFLCWKFRTMKVAADTTEHQRHFKHLQQSGAPMTKMDALGDQRLIPLGAILRATGFDELPQLLNVWRGEMSLVGPRPCTPYELEGYSPWQHARFDTLPGLTGLWQVSGKNKTTFMEMIGLDICYARNKSLWLDLKIMAKTFSTLVSQVRELPAKTARSAQAAQVCHDRSKWYSSPKGREPRFRKSRFIWRCAPFGKPSAILTRGAEGNM
jgi:exopolysaccharide production protein ExoY